MSIRVISLFLLIAFSVVTVPQAAFACSCVWGGSFVAVAKSSPLIVRGKVLSHDVEKPNRPLFMKFQIAEVLYGSYSPGPIRIWGDNGFQCLPNIKNFPIGTEWIFALSGPNGNPSGKGEIHLSNCGDYWLRVNGAYVRGNVKGSSRGTKQNVPIIELRRLLKKVR